MDNEAQAKYVVAVIGAGPAGLFAARQLASEGARVALVNRDIKPGGLAEYGIYPTKHKMKEGLRKQFRQILQIPEIDYFGNVTIGEKGDLTLAQLKATGIQALLVTVGAQGTKWLGLPGEQIPKGVYHAKDIVYHYNKLPPYSQKQFYIGQKVALIGAGNVSLDIARWLMRQLKVEEVVAVVRRGPAEVKFDKKEMESVAANLDLKALDEEITRVAPVMEAIGQDVQGAKDFILSALQKAQEPVSDSRFRFEFLTIPVSILGNAGGQVTGLEVEETTLIPVDGDTKAEGTGVKRVVDVDTVIFCIGDKVDDTLGIPVQKSKFVKSNKPRFPVDGVSFELMDPASEALIEDIFVAGWAREASHGLVGVARKDGENGAQVVLQYLRTLEPMDNPQAVMENVRQLFQKLDKPVINKEEIQRLEAIEQAEAERLMLEEFKYSTNEEMLAAIGVTQHTA